jgi:heptosyltransferase-2
VSERILVIGPAWVGDMVMAQSLFRTLATRGPSIEVDVVAPGWSLPLLRRMPEVTAGIEMPAGHGELRAWRRFRIGRALRHRGYDQALVLPRSYKSALVPCFAAVPRRTGYRGEWRYGLLNDIRPLDKSILIQTVQRFVALGLEADADLPPPVPRPRLTVDKANQARLLERLALDLSRPVVALAPGAEFGASKRWPPEHFAATARALVESGYRVWVLGSAKEREMGVALREQAGAAAVNLCGETALVDAVDLLALTEHTIANDSGLMHVAAAVGSHVIAIYGSTPPDLAPPLTTRCEVHYLGLDCSPCLQRECPLGHLRCLREITPERVLAGLRPRAGC